jgi:hypothetical protein
MYTVCTVHCLGICQVSQNKGENSKTLCNDEKMKGRLNIYKLCIVSVLVHKEEICSYPIYSIKCC